MKATTSENDANTILAIVEELVHHIAAIGNKPVTDKAARKTAWKLLDRAVLATGSSAAHPDCPSLLKELDTRRGLLPEAHCPKRFSERRTALAYDAGFEGGFRGWPKVNQHHGRDCRRAWTEGYDAGEAALQNCLVIHATSLPPVAWLDGWHSGNAGLSKESPYLRARHVPSGDQLESHDAWIAGYAIGTGAQAVAA